MMNVGIVAAADGQGRIDSRGNIGERNGVDRREDIGVQCDIGRRRDIDRQDNIEERGDRGRGRLERAKPGNGFTSRWLPALVVLTLLGGLGWRLLGGLEPGTPGDLKAAVDTVSDDDNRSTDTRSRDIALAVAEVVRATGETLASIGDEAEARAALPALKDAHRRIGDLGDAAATLPSGERETLVAIVAPALSDFRPLAEQVLGQPGAGAVVAPVLEPLIASLEGLTRR